MIHELLKLTRPLIVLDTETTGLSDTDRIVELAFQHFAPDGEVKEWRSLINPGVPIPEAVTKVHGIRDGDFRSCRVCAYYQSAHPVVQSDVTMQPCEEYKPWPTFAQVAPRLAKGFTDCDFAGQNVRFDLRKLAYEFKLTKVEWSYSDARILDSGRLEALLNPRHLSDLYRKYAGKELEDAHHALVDVKATVDVLVAQLNFDILPMDLDALHELQWPGWIGVEGKFYFNNGVPCFNAER